MNDGKKIKPSFTSDMQRLDCSTSVLGLLLSAVDYSKCTKSHALLFYSRRGVTQICRKVEAVMSEDHTSDVLHTEKQTP